MPDAPTLPPVTPDVLIQAKSLTTLGIPVFPCRPQTKIPATDNGFYAATTEATQIAQWSRTQPNANWGAYLGPAHLLAADFDVKPETQKDGRPYYAAHPDLFPDTVRILTSNGGFQNIYSVPPDVRLGSTNGRLHPAFDSRAWDGYIMVPGSIHPTGQIYRWAPGCSPQDRPFSPAPLALITLLTDAPQTAPPPLTLPAGTPTARSADEVIRLATKFNAPKFPTLMRGDAGAYGNDESDAEMALCCQAAFYTRDSGVIEEVVTRSGFGKRDKWQSRQDYRDRTIRKALAFVNTYYTGTRSRTAPIPPIPTPSTNGAHPPTDLPPDTTPANTNSDPGKGLMRTDYGNAEYLVRLHGQDIHYTKGLGWLVWDGVRWQRDETGEIMRRAKATVRQMYTDSWELGADEGAALRKHAVKSESAGALHGMIGLAESEEGIPLAPTAWDTNPWLLTCPNGTLDLRTGHLRPPTRTDLITRCTGVAFDPEAECPIWDRFLDRILGENADLLAYFQRAVGYGLTGSIQEQCMFLLHGTGHNGKSTLLHVLQTVLGDYAQSTPAATLLVRPDGAATNDLARMAGARFVAAMESEEGKRLAEALIKQMTGGDKLVARFLRQEFFEFTPVFKLFFATNHKPIIRGTDLAIWRRIHLVPFTVTIPPAERDKTLVEKLQAEAAGILTWAVSGCLSWQTQGLNSPQEVLAATAGYRAEMDLLGTFLVECCLLGNARLDVLHKDLYEAYERWAEENGERPLTSRQFVTRLTERGLFSERATVNHNLLTWYGIALLSDR